MKRYIKQKVFSWGDKFSIYDENEREVHFCEGEVFSFGKKLHLYGSKYNNEECYISQKVFSFMPKFYIDIDGMAQIEINKEFTFFSQQYSVDPLGWQISGDFWAHTYEITCRGELIAAISKQWFTWGDTYEIEIINDENELPVLAVVLVIDAVLDASAAAASASNNS